MNALRGETLDFVLLCSSVAALLGGVGQVDYCGANAFLDAFAHYAKANGGPPVFSVNWDAWKEVGMAVNTPVPGALQAMRDFSLKVGISPAEGVDALRRILAVAQPQLAVFTMDRRPAIFHAQWCRKAAPPVVAAVGAAPTASEAPPESTGSDVERVVIEAWERILGRDQIGLNDNFFELGGDSLTALQVVAILKARLGREVPIVTFYEAPTVALLARALGDGSREKPVALEGVEHRAETRRELMQKRRQQRTAPAVLDPSR
jgi:acyl carrier protein